MSDDLTIPLESDHKVAELLAQTAGQILLQTRQFRRAEGPVLGDAGDYAAQLILQQAFAEQRPADAVLSEEAQDDPGRLSADRVWIVDPLDGTREYSELRDDWAVHVALWERIGPDAGELTAGAVALPDLDTTFHTGVPPVVPPRSAERLRIAVSRSRPPAFVEKLAEELGAELVPMGSAGFKVMSVVRGIADAYVHAGGQYEWDSAAPVAVAAAAGLHTSRVDGSPLEYNQENVYLPDLVVCRSELAEPILSWLAERGTGLD